MSMNTPPTCVRSWLPRPGARPWLLLLLLLPVAVPARSASTQVEVERTSSHLDVRALIEADAPRALCYEVLVDFDRLAEFVPGLRTSRIVSAPGEPLRLHQVGEADLGFKRYLLEVTLAVNLDPPRQITFERIDGNLEVMEGSWQVDGTDERCTIRYRAALKPAFWVPPLIGPLLVRRQVQQQVDGLAAEIDRRRAQGSATGMFRPREPAVAALAAVQRG
jgi:ribosome-associated toxin RatA of RatAB toxin-antitoxin module